MTSTTWKVVRLSDPQRYAVARVGGAAIEYHCEPGQQDRWTTRHLKKARSLVVLLNGRQPTRRLVSANEFASMIRHVSMRPRTIDALRDIMVNGKTWARASAYHRITESGILRAMRRLSTQNEP